MEAMNEARTSSKMERNPNTVYWEKLQLFADQNSWANLIMHWGDAGRQFRENQIMRLLMHNFPGPAGAFMALMPRINPATKKPYLPWGERWIEGINQTFDTMLDAVLFRENFARCQETNMQAGVAEDERFIKQMKTNGKRGRQSKMLEGITEIAGSFTELYRVITNPVNDRLYAKSYKKKSISGKRGRPAPDGTFIEFNMKKMPVIMVRGKYPFSDTVPEMNDCYALVGMDRPGNGNKAVTDWLITLKRTFRKKMEVLGYNTPYRYITPCSLEYWMDKINEDRRYFTDTDLLGRPTTRKRMFKASTILQLRENGSYRFYAEGMEDNDEGWQPDPMQDKAFISKIEDEFGIEKLKVEESNITNIAMNKRDNKSLYESVDEFGLDPTNYESYDDYLRDKAELMVNDVFEDLDYEQKQELINGLLDQDEDEWEDWCMNMYADYGATNMMANRNESVKNYLGRRRMIMEGKALTPEEKMDRWHKGTRKENIKACSDEKLKEYRKICRAKGYAEEVRQINAEIKRRKVEGVNESEVLDEAKKDGGPRNSVLYGFLLNKVAPIVAKTIVENGFTAEVHDNTKDKVKDIKVDVKKGGIGGITRIFVNYYNGETYIAISNHKFLNGNEKTALAFVSPLDNCVYIVPSPVLQSNWRNIMHSDRSIVSVSDALGMRNEISICDVAKVCELAEDEGYVYNMSADSAAKFHTELTKYEEVDTNERKRNMTESEMAKYPGFDVLCEGEAQPNFEEKKTLFTLPPEPKYRFQEEVTYYNWSQAYNALKFYNEKIANLVVPFLNSATAADGTAARKQISKMVYEAISIMRKLSKNPSKPEYPISEMMKPLVSIWNIARDYEGHYMETQGWNKNLWYKFIYDDCLEITHKYCKKFEQMLDELKSLIRTLSKSVNEFGDED